jgi:hypothetical protein
VIFVEYLNIKRKKIMDKVVAEEIREGQKRK